MFNKDFGFKKEAQGGHTHVPEDDTHVDVIEELDLGVSIHEPKGEWDDEAKQVSDRDPLVSSTNREHVAGDGPRDGERVILLDVLARPDVGAFDGGEDVELVGHNGLHHDVVEDGANDSAHHLRSEGAFRGQVDQLGELEITAEPLALLDAVEAEDCEVHIG